MRRFNRRFLSSNALTRLIGSSSALALLVGAASAQAQQATPYSIGEMLQAGGLALPLGITAQAEIITTGTGANAIVSQHGQTGVNPAFIGGRLDTPPDVGFAETTNPLGGAEFATRISSGDRSQLTNGTTTQYESSIGFKVTFSQPTPAAYFYGLDVDGDEWKTVFGFDNAGNFIAPNILTEPGTSNLTILPNTPIDKAGWEADIPGLTVPSELDLIAVGTFSSPVGPETTTNQVIYDFGGQALTELYFFYGLGGPASNANPSNSGISAFFLNVPAMEVTKTATVGALQADNTFDITYELLIENTGAAAFESFSLSDDLAAVSNLGSVFNTITPAGVTFAPVVSSGGSNFPAPNSAFDGNGASGDAELVDPADSVLFQPGDSFTLTFTANVDASSIPVDLSNSASASAQPVGFGGSLLSENSDNDSNDSNGDNPTVITAPAAVTGPADPITLPNVCGAYNSTGWLTNAVIGLTDSVVVFGSGDPNNDPFVYTALSRDADGRIASSFGTPDTSTSGFLPAQMGIPLTQQNRFDPDLESEYHLSVIRLEGAPGTTVTADVDTVNLQEQTTFWVEDSSGNVIDQGDFVFTFGAGLESLPVSFTAPADGIAYLHVGIFDPTASFGRPRIENYACPNPELELTKVADNNSGRALGDTITYTYTATNTGDINIDDVTVSDVHNGSGTLSPITINASTNTSGNSSDDGSDDDFDVLAPGDSVTFEASYVVTLADVTAGSNITNTATATGDPAAGTLTAEPTANESVSIQAPINLPALPPLTPGTCGGVLAEAYLLDGMGIGGEQSYQLASGSLTHDPDVFFGLFGSEHGYTKNADGTVDYFFDAEAPVQTLDSDIDSVSFGNITAITGSASDQSDAAEFWRVAVRLDGIPGESYSFDADNGNAHEFMYYWAEDSSGTVLDSSTGNPNTANGWIYGATSAASTSSADGATSIVGQTTIPFSYTIPASSPDGIVYLRALVLDPQVGWGRLSFAGAPECPEPSLSMTKVADSKGPHAEGDVITYTYSVTNNGNVNVKDINIVDTHNGSDPAPTPTNETLLTDVAPLGDSVDAAPDGSWDVIAPGDTVTFTGTYTITAIDAVNL